MAELPPLFPEDHVCERCSLAYADLSVDRALRLVETSVTSLAELLPRIPEPVLRRRRESEEWSPLEYAGHVRDVLLTFALRVHRGLVEDRPVLEPMYADWRAERFGYRSAAVPEVLAGMRAAAGGFTAEVRAVPVGSWERTVTRRPDEVRTVRWLVRQAAHETVHHLADVGRLAAG